MTEKPFYDYIVCDVQGTLLGMFDKSLQQHVVDYLTEQFQRGSMIIVWSGMSVPASILAALDTVHVVTWSKSDLVELAAYIGDASTLFIDDHDLMDGFKTTTSYIHPDDLPKTVT